MIRTALVVVAVMLVVLALLVGFQRRLIYFPSTAPVPAAGEVLPGARDVVLRTSDGLRLGAWFVPSARPDARPDAGAAVLVANGNAGDRVLRAPLAQALARHGLSVLLFDYRGYGANPGNPSEEGLARDVRAAYRHLVEEIGMAPRRIIYYGESLGAAVVTELATEHPPGGLLLRSPFVDLAAVGHVHYPFLPVRTLLWDRYQLSKNLAEVTVPVTVVYGSADSVIPADQSRVVARVAPNLRRLVAVDGADHNDAVLLDGDVLIRAVVDLAGAVDRPS